jgi:hypothetical protein
MDKVHARQGGSLKAKAVVEAYLKHPGDAHTGGELAGVSDPNRYAGS